jgi:hypothetical protein
MKEAGEVEVRVSHLHRQEQVTDLVLCVPGLGMSRGSGPPCWSDIAPPVRVRPVVAVGWYGQPAWGLLLAGAGRAEPVGPATGLHDQGVEGQLVDDGGGQPGSVKVWPLGLRTTPSSTSGSLGQLAGSVLGPVLSGPGGSSPPGVALDRLLAQLAMKSADLSRSIGGDPAVHIQPGCVPPAPGDYRIADPFEPVARERRHLVAVRIEPIVIGILK